MTSIIQNNKECFVCGTKNNLHKHHIFEGRNRSNSEKYGCWCFLCNIHHNMSGKGVHFNKELDNRLKELAEIKWLCQDYDRNINDFIDIFRRNYL